jgi:hypothetical protein
MSACIENSGQCTALRHAVVNCSMEEVQSMFTPAPTLADSRQALSQGEFAGVFDKQNMTEGLAPADGYTAHPGNPHIR